MFRLIIELSITEDDAVTDKTMLAAPDSSNWAEHPAARAGKLEKRGKLKDEWKARHFELRGCYLVCFADAKEGRPALAVFDVTKVACARDPNDGDDVFGLRVLWPLIISSLCFC